jgi:signal transduction histidine kinase
MKNEAITLLNLHFADKEMERQFIKEYDSENRIFFRIGIYLSCFAWCIWYSGVYFSHSDVFSEALAVLISVLLLPFIIVVVLSFFKNYSTLNHNITAFCNFAAACICIYVAVYLSKDITLLCAGVVCINFFCYFILRIRYIVSLFVTAGYGCIAQYCVLTSGSFRSSEIFTASSGIWLGFFIATIAGYFFEKTNRRLFVQNKLIEEQQGELIDEKNKLTQSLVELKSTQAQLIHSEKMASLGELTAGIAHEIQNPLNFVNNFSEINKELIQEFNAEWKNENESSNKAIEQEILNDIEQNLDKVLYHGKRADAIVKGMLQHSRNSIGVKEPTNINVLAGEYLRLAYHGFRAKDKEFNVEIKTDFDENAGHIYIVPQDIGRVLLNMYNNAFYAVRPPQPLAGATHFPTVTVSTKRIGKTLDIRIADNGHGISQKIVDKIFQPFFTTKPTGQGTGLGLSLSYDIVKAHGGEIKVESEEGYGSKFTILFYQDQS